MSRLPTVFISHGAPTLPIDPSMPSAEFASFATRFERPRSILMLSAHWGTAQPVASIAEQPETIHDFYGFPRALYEIRYRAPGAPELGKHAATLLTQAGICVGGHRTRPGSRRVGSVVADVPGCGHSGRATIDTTASRSGAPLPHRPCVAGIARRWRDDRGLGPDHAQPAYGRFRRAGRKTGIRV